MTTELGFGNSYIAITDVKNKTFEIVMGDEMFGIQSITNLEAKEIADFIYESLGLTLHKPLIVNLSDISEDQREDLMKQIKESGKNLATITLQK